VVKREFTGAKKTLMENDPDLRVLYDEVVGSGLVTDEEFWEARKDQIRQVEAAVYSANPNNSQRTGLSSELASVRALSLSSIRVAVVVLTSYRRG
jgi:hypothetical protein